MLNLRKAKKGDSFGKVFFFFLFGIPLFFFLIYLGLEIPFYIFGGFLIAFGFTPLIIQLSTGYAIDQTWKLRFSRKGEPFRYWIHLFLSLIIGLWFLFITLSIIFDMSK